MSIILSRYKNSRKGGHIGSIGRLQLKAMQGIRLCECGRLVRAVNESVGGMDIVVIWVSGMASALDTERRQSRTCAGLVTEYWKDDRSKRCKIYLVS